MKAIVLFVLHSWVMIALQCCIFQSTARAHEEQSRFELGASFSGSLDQNGQGRVGSYRFPVRFYLFDGANLGLEARYWPAGSYPLSTGASAVIATGADGQIYFLNHGGFGAYVGGALLWAPAHGQVILCPEVGFKVFVTQKVAIGAAYDVATDLGSFLLSLAPSGTSGSIQSLGVNLTIEL